MSVNFELLPDRTRIAYLQDGAEGRTGRTGFFWLGGYKSDMTGTKAEAIAALARETRRPSLRFDYSGHGQSSGLFIDGTISQWLDQSVHMFAKHTHDKCVVIGSSMGGWLAMLLVKKLQDVNFAIAQRIAGLVLIAPAADMTTELMWKDMPPAQRREIEERGVIHRPSDYGDSLPITARLLEDGVSHLILKSGLDAICPVRILQGDADPDVPSQHAWKVYESIKSNDVTFTLIKGGDHRLSTPGNLALIRETALHLAERADGITA
jgi:pimeloyl-ACP methyl ester carboxylesterase